MPSWARIIHDQQFGPSRPTLMSSRRWVWAASTPHPSLRLGAQHALPIGYAWGLGRFGFDQVWSVKAQQQIAVELMLGVEYTANLNDFLKRRLVGGFGNADATLQFRDRRRWTALGASHARSRRRHTAWALHTVRRLARSVAVTASRPVRQPLSIALERFA